MSKLDRLLKDCKKDITKNVLRSEIKMSSEDLEILKDIILNLYNELDKKKADKVINSINLKEGGQ